MTGSQPAPAVAEREVVFSRELSAPRELVFDTWTQQKHLQTWMHPAGFDSITVEKFDLRVGGEVRWRMQFHTGDVYTSVWTCREITPSSRFVYREICYENGKLFHDAHMTVTFEDITYDKSSPQTKLTIRALLELVADRDPRWTLDAMKQGWSAGWQSNYELLVEYLKTIKPGK